MPTRPSPRSERLGTPNTPAIRFTRGPFGCGVLNMTGTTGRSIRGMRFGRVIAMPRRRDDVSAAFLYRCNEGRPPLSQVRAYHLGFFLGASGSFFIDGFGKRIASQFLQLCKQCTSASFNGLSSLVQNWVFTRWHAGYLAFSRACFRDSRCCQRADALNNLPGIEATLAGEPLPVPPLEVVTPIFAGDLMGEILRDVLPHFAAHDVVHRCERRRRCLE